MGDLSILPEDVREALRICREWIPATDMDGKPNAWHAIELELLRLARENTNLRSAGTKTLAANVELRERAEAELDALKNLQYELSAQVVRAEKAEAELAALKTRIDEAPTCTLRAIVQGNIVWPVASDLSGDTRVALLPVGGEGE